MAVCSLQITTSGKRERMEDALASCALELSDSEMASLEAAADECSQLRAFWSSIDVEWD